MAKLSKVDPRDAKIAELEKAQASNLEELGARRERINRLEGLLAKKTEAVTTLKALHAEAEKDLARRDGYLDRVREDDMIRDGSAGRVAVETRHIEARTGPGGKFNADVWNASIMSRTDERKPWHDL